MYLVKNQRVVAQGMILNWTMQGRPGRNANIPFALQINFVRTENGKEGIILDMSGTKLSAGIDVSGMSGFDTMIYKGQVLWLKGYNGLCVTFEGDTYPLIKIEEVGEKEGVLYFHVYPPLEFDGGDLTLDDRSSLESLSI